MANRVSQAPVEVVSTSTALNARVSQDAVEVLHQPVSPRALVSQGAVEVVSTAAKGNSLVSQIYVEIVVLVTEKFVPSTKTLMNKSIESGGGPKTPSSISGKPKGVVTGG